MVEVKTAVDLGQKILENEWKGCNRNLSSHGNGLYLELVEVIQDCTYAQRCVH